MVLTTHGKICGARFKSLWRQFLNNRGFEMELNAPALILVIVPMWHSWQKLVLIIQRSRRELQGVCWSAATLFGKTVVDSKYPQKIALKFLYKVELRQNKFCIYRWAFEQLGVTYLCTPGTKVHKTGADVTTPELNACPTLNKK